MGEHSIDLDDVEETATTVAALRHRLRGRAEEKLRSTGNEVAAPPLLTGFRGIVYTGSERHFF